MQRVDQAELLRLAAERGEPLVSISMPVKRGGDGPIQNAVRLGNLLAAAREAVAARGLDESETKRFLAPARELLENPATWEGKLDGLAIFVSAMEFGLSA